MQESNTLQSEKNNDTEYYFLENGYRLEAVRLSANLRIQDGCQYIDKHLVTRVPAPDAVLQSCVDLYFKDHKRFYDLVARNLGNPTPYTEEMWRLVDWARLFYLSRTIDISILRDRPVDLDRDVLYSKKGLVYVEDTRIDSKERQRLEATCFRGNGSSQSYRYWSTTMHCIRQYYENSRKFNGLTEDEIQTLQTNWGLLRSVASVGGIFEEEASELFARASFHPYPLIIPFSEQDTWEWLHQELESFEEIDREIEAMKVNSFRERIEELRRESLSLQIEEQLKNEEKIRKLESFLENPSALSRDDQEFMEDIISTARKDTYRLLWSEAYELDMEHTGGETIPLSQVLEFEAENAYQAVLGWILWEIYVQLRSQMTRTERRLFLSLYIPSRFTSNRVPFLDQSVRDFISSGSEEVLGIALFVLSGVKQVGKFDLANLFTEYWKTWLWICDLVRSQSVDQIADVLRQQPTERHQYQGSPIIEISLDDDGVSDWLGTMIAMDGVTPIFRDDILFAEELDVETIALQRVVGGYPGILSRLINQYASTLQKEALCLKFLSGSDRILTQCEIAQRLNISQAAVSQRIEAGTRAILHGMKEEEKAGLIDWKDILE